MANDARYDRLLMRQRGTGARTTGNTDFDLGFSAAPSRKERQQMRQRGAGTRPVEAIDFGISFPTPSSSGRSKTRSSRERSSRSRTPLHKANRSSRERSTSRRSDSVGSHHAQREPGVEIHYDITNVEKSSSKRRRLDPDAILSTSTPNAMNTNNIDNLEPPTTRATRRISSLPAEDLSQAYTDEIIDDAGSDNLEQERLLAPETLLHGDKENVKSRSPKLAQKRRKRKSIGQKRRKQRKRPSTSSSLEETIDRPDDVDESIAFSESLIRDSNDQQTASMERYESSLPGVPIDISIGIPQRKQTKRKSILSETAKRRLSRRKGIASSSMIASLDENDDDKNRKSSEPPLDAHSFLSGESPGGAASTRSANSLNHRKRFESNPSHKRSEIILPEETSLERYEDEDEDEDGEYIEEDQSPEPPTPDRRRISRKQKSIVTRRSRPSNNGAQKISGNNKHRSSFPITIHRMANTQTLPMIEEVPEPALDSDVETNLVNSVFPDRGAPNAVDVLAQICRETIAANLDRVAIDKEGSSTTAEQKRKRSALETFGKELNGRLFEMSAAVENRMTLEQRVRKTRREKVNLQNEWIEIRRLREQAALKCDTLRRQHWENEETSKTQWRISEAAQRCEMELERSGKKEPEGLEHLIRATGAVVGKVHGSNDGLLNQVKNFNAQLSQVAILLERKGTIDI